MDIKKVLKEDLSITDFYVEIHLNVRLTSKNRGKDKSMKKPKFIRDNLFHAY